MQQLRVRLAVSADIDTYVDHVARHVAESGRDGMPHFALSRDTNRDNTRSSMLDRWGKSLTESLWGRTFVLVDDGTKRIVGHLELRGGRVPAEMHRATLGMGIERAYTKQRHGGRLLAAATEWARNSAKLSWIDLGVFENNEPARKFYARAGFVEAGKRTDAFRIDSGLHVTDISMSLRLD